MRGSWATRPIKKSEIIINSRKKKGLYSKTKTKETLSKWQNSKLRLFDPKVGALGSFFFLKIFFFF